MRSQKVLSNQQVKWYDEETTRLNYQVIFNEAKESSNESVFDEAELKSRLEMRDTAWKKKLQQEKEKAYREGFEAGQAEGYETAHQETDAKLEVIRTAIKEGHEEWQQRQEILEPGILDLAFELSEAILGIPVQDEQLRNNMLDTLRPIFQKLDNASRPVIKVCESDLEPVKALKEEFASELTMYFEVQNDCNPGEFILETDDETIVHQFREMLKELRKNLSLPTWK
jgi:flagellar assembly protein FliH